MSISNISFSGTLEAAYWQEFDEAMRATLGLRVVLASALAAALTLTGAATQPVVPRAQPDCRCEVVMAPVAYGTAAADDINFPL